MKVQPIMKSGNENFTWVRFERRTRQCMAVWDAKIKDDIKSVADKCRCFGDSKSILRVKINRNTQIVYTVSPGLSPITCSFKYRWKGEFFMIHGIEVPASLWRLYWVLLDRGLVRSALTHLYDRHI